MAKKLNPEYLFNRYVARFWGKVKKTDGCWLWTGAANTRGYGVTYFEAKQTYAHRVAWRLQHPESDLSGLYVCHTCDVPSCVNPSHLFVGTASDNQRDCLAKGRKRTRNGLLVPAPGYCSRGHNKEDVGSRVSKDGYTYCRLCLNRAKRDRDRARRERRAHA